MRADDPGATGLVLSGGGARAAYQAGALAAIAEMAPPGPSPFAVIAGQSAGAINAAGLACRADDFAAAADGLVQAWSRLEVRDVVRADAPTLAAGALRWTLTAASGGWLAPNPRSILDNAPLARTLLREIDFGRIAACLRSGDLGALAITATAHAPGGATAVTFFDAHADLPEWRRSHRVGRRARLGAEHVMASSALPFLFPAQRIGDMHYGDGSLSLRAPLSPAIRLGARRLLVISVRDPDPAEGAAPACPRPPSLGALAGQMLDLVFNDGLDSDLERVGQINALMEGIPHPVPGAGPLRPVEVVVLRPSRDLREIAARHSRAIPWTLRTLLRGIGDARRDSSGRDGRLASYLSFGAAYGAELIALGRADALARAADIRALIGGARRRDRIG